MMTVTGMNEKIRGGSGLSSMLMEDEEVGQPQQASGGLKQISSKTQINTIISGSAK
jgi:hypothetical protein